MLTLTTNVRGSYALARTGLQGYGHAMSANRTSGPYRRADPGVVRSRPTTFAEHKPDLTARIRYSSTLVPCYEMLTLPDAAESEGDARHARCIRNPVRGVNGCNGRRRTRADAARMTFPCSSPVRRGVAGNWPFQDSFAGLDMTIVLLPAGSDRQ